MDKEKDIIESWKLNSANWIDLINSSGIESRLLVTNQAILEAVLNHKPAKLLDVGCGEGWLSNELNKKNIEVTGIDVIPELVQKAAASIPGRFITASYEDIAMNHVDLNDLFDVIVINFALIGKESTENLLPALPRYLNANGKLLIQTLHPYSRKIIGDYNSGWKQGSWDGLGNKFTQPYEWYFRTLEDWQHLLHSSGFGKVITHQFFHPVSQSPVSVIFECSIDQET